jgi:hypothetical protein
VHGGGKVPAVQEAKSFHNFVPTVDPNLGVHVSYSFNRSDPDLDLFILFTQAICTTDFDLYLQHPPRLGSSPDGDAANSAFPGALLSNALAPFRIPSTPAVPRLQVQLT